MEYFVNTRVWNIFKKDFKRKISSQVEIVYQSKGYKEIAQTGLIGPGGTPISNNTLQNKFDYISILSEIQYSLFKKGSFGMRANLGIEQNILINRKIESENIWPVNQFYPVIRYGNNWNKYSLNYRLGFALNFQEKIIVNPFFSRSLTPLMNLDDLIVKDWIWGIKFNLSIKNIFISKE